MRILFVTAHKHLPELRGGMEVNTHELSMRLKSRGAAVGMLCGLAGKGLTGLRARFQIKVLKNSCPKDMTLGYPTWRAWNSVDHVGRIAQAFKPDAIIVQGGADFIPLITECLKLELPVFCYLHTQDELVLDQALLENPNLFFIANSLFTQSLHLEKKILGVIRPLIRPEFYATETDRSAAIFVNPARHKGLDVVLGIASACPDVPFIFVVNRSGAKDSLNREIDLKRYPNIRVIGPFADMRKAYSKAKVILAPSQCLETWGRIATEAHFSAIPVLASSRGGLSEAVGSGGICLPADTPLAGWVETFRSIWDDTNHYAELCDAARTYARREEIDPEFIVESFLNLISR